MLAPIFCFSLNLWSYEKELKYFQLILSGGVDNPIRCLFSEWKSAQRNGTERNRTQHNDYDYDSCTDEKYYDMYCTTVGHFSNLFLAQQWKLRYFFYGYTNSNVRPVFIFYRNQWRVNEISERVMGYVLKSSSWWRSVCCDIWLLWWLLPLK